MNKVLIQGAGITGLTLAGLLEQGNVPYRIIEKTPVLENIGAGLLLQQNAILILESLGVLKSFWGQNSRIMELNLGTKKTPKLGHISFPEEHPVIGVHRSVLQKALLSAVPTNKITFGRTIESISDSGSGYQVKTNDGITEDYDIVVGADGARSWIRKSLGIDQHLRNSNQWCWRTVVDGQPEPGAGYEIYHGRYRLGILPLGSNQSYIYWVESNCSEEQAKATTTEQLVNKISTVGALGTWVAKKLSPGSQWSLHPLADIKVQWGRENTVLIGDAAHALTPNLGQGAALGMEDAMILADFIMSGETDLAGRLKELRNLRVEKIRRMSFVAGRIAHLESWWMQALRNGMVRITPQNVALKQQIKTIQPFLNWHRTSRFHEPVSA